MFPQTVPYWEFTPNLFWLSLSVALHLVMMLAEYARNEEAEWLARTQLTQSS